MGTLRFTQKRVKSNSCKRTTKLKKYAKKFAACSNNGYSAENEDTKPVPAGKNFQWGTFQNYDKGFRLFAFKEDTAGSFGNYDFASGYAQDFYPYDQDSANYTAQIKSMFLHDYVDFSVTRAVNI